jgi:flavin reductase (DIM6/NTAB) family NADH-FMN oxidoreductase RutF
MFAQTGPKKPGGLLVKDTVTNARETGEFACSVVSEALKLAMNVSTEAFDEGVDEFEKAGLTKGEGRAIKAPHVADAPAVLECKTHQIVEMPAWEDGWMNIVVIGEVVGVHVREEYLVDGILDVTTYNPVARMGYKDYTTVQEKWEMDRPESEDWMAKFR